MSEMNHGTWFVLVIGASIAIDGSVRSLAFAQAGFYLTPSANLSEVYDDNVFSTSENPDEPTPVPTTPEAAAQPTPVAPRRTSKVDDFIFRATPGIEGGYQSQPFTLLAGYTFGADVYAENSDLDSAPARQAATLRGRYLPDPLLTLSLNAGYFQSDLARELNAPSVATETGVPVTALERPRSRAEVYTAATGVTYLFDPLTTLNGGYDFSHTHELGAATGDNHSLNAAVIRDLTPRDKIDLDYTYRYFSFENATPSTASAQPTPAQPAPEPSPTPSPTPSSASHGFNESSHAVTLGWRRQLTELTRVELRGGPRFREGSVDPEAQALIARQLERGEASFSYERTQTTSVGLVGSLEAETFVGRLAYEVLQNLSADAALGLYRSSRGNDSADVYTATLGARYRLLEWLSLIGSYWFSYQKGFVGPELDSGNRNEKFYHNVVTVGIEAAQPFRIY